VATVNISLTGAANPIDNGAPNHYKTGLADFCEEIDMPTNIKITAGDVQVRAELNDGPTAHAIAAALPITATTQRWGDEIYFAIPVEMELEKDATEVVDTGTLGYWPTGNAFCMFFGPTPVSRGDQIRAASAVSIIGAMLGDITELTTVPNGAKVRIELL